jgi:hypothetical protein
MAQVAPNLGEAISLTAQVQDRTQPISNEITRRRKEEEDLAAANRKAAEKSQADIEKYRDDLGKWAISAEAGIHPVYHEKIAMMAEKMRKRFAEGQEKYKENYSPSYDSELQKMKFELQQEADKDRQSTKNIVRDLGVKANDAKDKFNVNEGLLNSLNTRDYNEFIKANGGSDYYALGLNSPKPEILGWTKGAQQWAAKQKSLYVKNPDGSKTINPKIFEEQWAAAKTDPSLEWIHDADAVNQAAGYTPEQSEAQVKQYILNMLPNQPAPDKSTGAGTGSKAKFGFSEPELYERSSKEGSDNYYAVTVTKKGGGVLPANFYGNDKSQDVYGHPTGQVKKYENSGKVVMSVAVPDKSITSSSDWKEMDDEERGEWLERKYQEDPNKFRKEEVPLSGSNKDKFEKAFGKTVDETFKNIPATKKSSNNEKVVVMKDGKKYNLPKSQLEEAKKQGYVLSK